MLKFVFILILGVVCRGQIINEDLTVNHFNNLHPVEVSDATGDLRNPDLLTFILYRAATPNTPVTVFANEDSINGANFDSSLLTLMIIHGHDESAFSPVNQVIKNALFTVDDANVIVVDWSLYSRLTYSQAVSAVPTVAAGVATFIEALIAVPDNGTSDNNTDATAAAPAATLANMHIVGFHLGAHIAGIAGRSLSGLARITGLDPARSQWEAAGLRLQSTDALYVEVIHTDGGLLGNGLGDPIGDIDIFMNGGSNQPGCLTHSCSHNRAYEFFAASMINGNLLAEPCSSMLVVNLNLCKGTSLRVGVHNLLMKPGTGIYRSNTRRSYPF